MIALQKTIFERFCEKRYLNYKQFTLHCNKVDVSEMRELADALFQYVPCIALRMDVRILQPDWLQKAAKWASEKDLLIDIQMVSHDINGVLDWLEVFVRKGSMSLYEMSDIAREHAQLGNATTDYEFEDCDLMAPLCSAKADE